MSGVPVKFPRNPKRVDYEVNVVQRWDPEFQKWEDIFSRTGLWPGGKVAKLRKPGEITRIITRKGRVTEKVEMVVTDRGYEYPPGTRR